MPFGDPLLGRPKTSVVPFFAESPIRGDLVDVVQEGPIACCRFVHLESKKKEELKTLKSERPKVVEGETESLSCRKVRRRKERAVKRFTPTRRPKTVLDVEMERGRSGPGAREQ